MFELLKESLDVVSKLTRSNKFKFTGLTDKERVCIETIEVSANKRLHNLNQFTYLTNDWLKSMEHTIKLLAMDPNDKFNQGVLFAKINCFEDFEPLARDIMTEEQSNKFELYKKLCRDYINGVSQETKEEIK